jgi:AraC-like DNA-binding protein
MSLYVAGSAGERFGNVLRFRRAGEFELRLSRYAPNVRFPEHHHPSGYFSLVVRGGMDEWTERGTSRFESGSVHYHAPLESHGARTGPLGVTSLSIIPHGTLAGRLASRMEHGNQAGCDHAWRWPAERCYHEFLADDDAAVLATEAAALELVAATLRGAAATRRTPPWLGAVRAHLECHFASPVRMRDLAAIAGVHEVYLIRGFRRHMGATPGTYLKRLRVDAARHELSASARPIVEIALATGFASQSHLTRVFHRATGMPPGAYRLRFGRHGT